MEPQRQPFCTRSRATWKTPGGWWRSPEGHPHGHAVVCRVYWYLFWMRWRHSMACKTEELSIDLLERVLMKLGLSNRPAPTLDGLQTLYAAWCRKVPFDNVRKLIHLYNHDPGPLPGDDATDFFNAWLTYGTGGTCWAGHG